MSYCFKNTIINLQDHSVAKKVWITLINLLFD